MATLNQSTPSPSSAPAKAANKARATNKKLIVVLRLSPSSLSKISFVETPQRKVSRAKHILVPAPAPATDSIEGDEKGSPSAEADASLAKQEQNGDSTAPAAPSSKRKTASGSKVGTKRPASVTGDVEGGPKQRGKPGPKKKAKLEGEIHNGTKGPTGGATPISTHKLGPKANQGAINAGLRALDRSGKPCRRWVRKAFEVKSFTGISWGLPSWRTPRNATTSFGGDVKSDSSGSVHAKGEQSEKSVGGGEANGGQPLHDLVSSPAAEIMPHTPVDA